MELVRLLARYHPATLTIEFDLADAPLIEAVVDVSVLSTTRIPSVESMGHSGAQNGLFYGKDAFVFERSFVFDSDGALQLTCWMRIREYDTESLHAIASAVTQGENKDPGATKDEVRVQQRECLVRLYGIAPPMHCSTEFLYFSTLSFPSSRSNAIPVDECSPLPQQCAPPSSGFPLDAALLLSSALALCLESQC